MRDARTDQVVFSTRICHRVGVPEANKNTVSLLLTMIFISHWSRSRMARSSLTRARLPKTSRRGSILPRERGRGA